MFKNFIQTSPGQFTVALGTGIVLTVIAAIVSNSSEHNYSVTLRISHDRPAGSITDLTAQKFKKMIEENSGGQVTVNIFPNNGIAAGDQKRAIEMATEGSIDLQIGSAVDLYALDKRFGAFWTPFLFENDEQVNYFVNNQSVRENLQNWLTPYHLTLLDVNATAALQLSNNVQPIETPDDLSKVKLGVPPYDFVVDTFKTLGANPVAVDSSEVPHYIKTNEISGQISNIAVFLSSKLYEEQPYVTIWNGIYGIQTWVANSDNLDKLSKQQKEAFTKSMVDALAWRQGLVSQFNSLFMKTLEQRGVKVNVLTPEQLKLFQEKAKPIYEKYIESLGMDTMLFFLNNRGIDADKTTPLVPVEGAISKNANEAAQELVETAPELVTEPSKTEEAATPAEETTAPAEEVKAEEAKPAEETTAPAEKVKAEEAKPAEETTAPAEEVKAEEAKPAEEAAAPAEKVKAEEAKPAEEAAAPTEEVKAEEAKPAEEAAASAEEVKAEEAKPAEEAAAPTCTIYRAPHRLS